MARLLLPACLLALAGLAPAAAIAQGLDQAAPAAGDADRLAAQMRLLAANPTDLAALLMAGELSIRIDDLGAAASFFARAEKIDPHSGRAKAGEGAILVRAERPGEALRYFAQAESYGLAPAALAADRGLAYDLIGEQERAQRDYRLALRTAPDEETQRRYALSLAIAGKRELADQELQPLLRKSDRGAWRVHAFVLALGGNVAEAERIATTMMPPGTAAGLQPFLEKLPTLAPIDRAFAVHFGEVRSTPQRIADAKLAPPLAALGPDPYAPRVQVAAVVVDKGKKRDDKRKRGKHEPVQVAVVAPAPEPLPQAPAYRPAAGTPPVLAMRGTAPTEWPTATARAEAARERAALLPVRTEATGLATTGGRLAPTGAPPAESNVVVGAAASARSPAPIAVTPGRPVAPAVMSVVVAQQSPRATLPALAQSAPPPSAVAPTTLAAVEPIAPVAAPPLDAADTPRPAPAPVIMASSSIAPRRRDDIALSRIVAGLPIPASELGVVGPAPARPDPAVLAAKAAADKRAADKKAAAEKKALADKKAAAAKKAEEAREEAAQKKIERANPERIWVQVAGGANAHDLHKAWAGAKAKGGDAFAGHATGWTTPLRFTNRVLAGPFKTQEEARAFVNKAKGAGLSAFTFTSDAGQVVTKLAAE